MYLGHIAAGLAAKPIAPKASVGVLLVSATALDTLIGVFLLTGVERVDLVTQDSYMPWSHGLFMSAVWSVRPLRLHSWSPVTAEPVSSSGYSYSAIGFWISSATRCFQPFLICRFSLTDRRRSDLDCTAPPPRLF